MAIPVETITGFFVLLISSISSKLDTSKEAILKSFTPNLFKKITDSLSKGVEKNQFFFVTIFFIILKSSNCNSHFLKF